VTRAASAYSVPRVIFHLQPRAASNSFSYQGMASGKEQALRLSGLLALVTADYQREGYSSAARLPVKLAHVHRLMGDPRVEDVDTAAIRGYQNRRLTEGAARGTVELETCAIGRGFSIARENGALRYVPKIPHLHLDNARQGFYLRADFEAIVAHLAPHWRIFAWACYHTGWRPTELLTRQWRHLDLERGWMRLEPTEAKNRHGRECPLVPELLALLRERRDMCTTLARRENRVIPWVFYNPGRPGARLHVYSVAWKAARDAAGMPGRLLYDFRRTAVRNLEQAAVPRSAAMAMVGHRTQAMYSRYAIADRGLLESAGVKLTMFHQGAIGERPKVISLPVKDSA